MPVELAILFPGKYGFVLQVKTFEQHSPVERDRFRSRIVSARALAEIQCAEQVTRIVILRRTQRMRDRQVIQNRRVTSTLQQRCEALDDGVKRLPFSCEDELDSHFQRGTVVRVCTPCQAGERDQLTITQL